MQSDTLIFVPTYNERDHAPQMCEEISALALDADLLFVDDNSPDGTGEILESLKERYPRLIVQHRPGKLGIGSAHFDAIEWAYDQGYQRMVTMDCDFSHSPTDIPCMLKATEDCDISVGSRWMHPDSLPGWNILRRCLTWVGHILTSRVLGIPQDASGAFRAYRLDRLPREVFSLVQSRGYAFFFESLFVLGCNDISVREVPIRLPARTYGHSKMTTSAALRSGSYIFELWLEHLRRPERFLLERKKPEIDPTITDPQDWDSYWDQQTDTGGAVYELIAGVYRRSVIKRNLNRALRRCFPEGSALLHAGCGSGQVDTDIQSDMQLTALDISPSALRRYSRNNPKATNVRHGSIFALPFDDASFDGVYNLGVVEHFTREEIVKILSEFRRVLRPGGKAVIFWPHARATSVLVLNTCHKIMKSLLKSKRQLHPPEISLLQSKKWAESLIAQSGLVMTDYRFGIDDFFVQAVVVAEKRGTSND